MKENRQSDTYLKWGKRMRYQVRATGVKAGLLWLVRKSA